MLDPNKKRKYKNDAGKIVSRPRFKAERDYIRTTGNNPPDARQWDALYARGVRP